MPTSEYRVMEHFHTIQGEGVYTGHSAYFIRLGGCDVGCSWCDVKESWAADAHPLTGTDELVHAVVASGAPIAVITGGEPLMQDLTHLTASLRSAGIRTHLETSGSSPMSGIFDWVTLSPKKFKAPLPEIYPNVHELKVVVLNRSDLTWATIHAERCPPQTRRMLQPEWGTPQSMPLIVDFVKSHPDWTVSLQTHKFLNIP